MDVELGTYAVAKRESGEWRPAGEERSPLVMPSREAGQTTDINRTGTDNHNRLPPSYNRLHVGDTEETQRRVKILISARGIRLSAKLRDEDEQENHDSEEPEGHQDLTSHTTVHIGRRRLISGHENLGPRRLGS